MDNIGAGGKQFVHCRVSIIRGSIVLGGSDEAADVDPILGWQDAPAGHSETETSLDGETGFLSPDS